MYIHQLHSNQLLMYVHLCVGVVCMYCAFMNIPVLYLQIRSVCTLNLLHSNQLLMYVHLCVGVVCMYCAFMNILYLQIRSVCTLNLLHSNQLHYVYVHLWTWHVCVCVCVYVYVHVHVRMYIVYNIIIRVCMHCVYVYVGTINCWSLPSN